MKHLVRFDWAIKRLLRNKANFDILEGLLSELLYDDIKIETILESESNKETGDNKSNRVDMLVKNTKGELIIIEIQTNRVHDYLMRMLFGTAKLIVDNMYEGMGYNQVKKVISINIVYFDLGQGADYLYYGTTNFKGLTKGDDLKLSAQQEKIYHVDSIAKLYPEYYIIKVGHFNEEPAAKLNPLEQWIYFLKNDEIKDSFKARGLEQAKERLDVMKLSRTEKADYDRFIKDWRDYNSLTVSNYDAGKAEGKAEGKQETRIEMAKVLKASGVPVSVIMKSSGLSEEEINAL